MLVGTSTIEQKSGHEEITIPTKVFLSLGVLFFCLVFVTALLGG